MRLLFSLLFLTLLIASPESAFAQITDDTTIDSDVDYLQGITITNGATLTITGGAEVTSSGNIVIEDGVLLLTGQGNPTLKMGPDRTIKVRTTGELVVEDATITSISTGPGQAWRGIGVEGPGNNP